MKKRWKVGAAAVCMSLLVGLTAYAGSWQESFGRLWWKNDDGSYPTSGWHWINEKNDGFAECYYFDEKGFVLRNTTTPDGYTVNENGEWVIDEIVQTQKVPVIGTLAPEEPYQDTKLLFGKMSSDGYDDMEYFLHIPENATENMPMIVVLKNFMNAKSAEQPLKEPMSQYLLNNPEKFPAYVLIPNLYYRDANSYYDYQLHSIARLIQLVAQDKKVDMNRISITGGSQSASGTIKMVSEYPELFSCAVPCALFSNGDIASKNKIAIAASKVPTWFIGEDLPIVNYYGTLTVEKINSLGGNAWFTLDEGAEHSQCGGFKANVDKFGVVDWMLSQTRATIKNK